MRHSVVQYILYHFFFYYQPTNYLKLSQNTKEFFMNKQEEKAAQTKAALVDAFWKLYLTKPVEKISVKEITDATGVYRSTLYYYFPDVYAILEYIEEDILHDWEQLISDIFSDHKDILLRGAFVELAPWASDFKKKHGSQIAVLLGPNGDPSFQQKIKDTLQKKLFALLKIRDNNLEALLTYEACVSGILALGLKWYTENIPFETIASVAQTIIHPDLFKTMLNYSSNPILKRL
ncbi:MAG: TetR/AcrR family transcriptional regulator [Peptococcaceae bacterium]|nr:TetR/AcrR family transcriptional regulator [Peptococcaceae bacterium]